MNTSGGLEGEPMLSSLDLSKNQKSSAGGQILLVIFLDIQMDIKLSNA